MTHVLKTWPKFFEAVSFGLKTAEVRKFDRDFRKYDKLELQEYDIKLKKHTGKTCIVKITDLISDFPGIEKGYCVLSIKLIIGGTNYNLNIAGKR